MNGPHFLGSVWLTGPVAITTLPRICLACPGAPCRDLCECCPPPSGRRLRCSGGQDGGAESVVTSVSCKLRGYMGNRSTNTIICSDETHGVTDSSRLYDNASI